MIVVHLLLFSVLLYNTEAVYDDDKTTTVRSTAIKATIPVEDTTTTNRTETIGWYFGSGAVEKNETRDYKSGPVEEKRPAPVTETTDRWSYESGVVEKNETRDYKSVPVEEKRPAPVTETTDRWSYESGVVEKNETRDYKSVPVENPAAVSDKEPANSTYEFADTKPYEDDGGYLIVDNGTLTIHWPKIGNEKKKITKLAGWRNRHNPFYGPLETTTSTRRPYYSSWYNELENDRTTTESSYYRYNATVKDSETTTTRRPYYSYWGKETDGYKSKTTEPYYGYNKTAVESETTTTRRPYYWYWNDIIGKYKLTTIHTPHHHHYDHYRTSYYRYNQTVNDSETTTTRRPYYSYWDKETDGDKSKTAAPYYGYDKTVVESEDDDRRPYYWYWNNTPHHHHHDHYRTSYYRDNQTVKDSETPTTWYNKRVDSPIVNRANSSDQNASRRNTVNISINSSINANESRNYGEFIDFLKKISGYILPSVSNIAPNSNITNLAVVNAVNGNGNLFFYVG